MTPRWRHADPEVRRAVAAWLAGEAEPSARVLAHSDRRQVVRLELGPGRAICVKRFFAPRRGRRLRRLKQLAGCAPAQREWRALRRLCEAGLPVPQPLGLAHGEATEALLVTRFAEGAPFADLLRRPLSDRRHALRALGRCVANFHAAGLVHGDLHVGNLLANANGPVLLDLQRARRATARGRRRDLGQLDFSLARAGFSRPDRLRLRAAALALLETRSAGAKRALRAVGRASARRARQHWASRTRRCLRPGRRFARIDGPSGRGLRAVGFPPRAVDEALRAHRAALAAGDARVLKCDTRARVTGVRAGGRELVVKEVTKPGRARQLADWLRGSPARRGWRGGHGLLARGITAAAPLAYVEQRRLGLPVASALILEDLRPARPVSELRAGDVDPPALGHALARLARSLHARGVRHGDLQCLHIFLASRAGRPLPALIDLEGVRFPRRLSERARIAALAELNASLAEALVPNPLRRRLFAWYARALPFRCGAETALRRIVARSRARHQLWPEPPTARPPDPAQ